MRYKYFTFIVLVTPSLNLKIHQMSRKSASNVKKVLINLFQYLHILISFGHKLRKESTLFFVNLVKLTSKFRDGVTALPWVSSGNYLGNRICNVQDGYQQDAKE